MALVMSFADWVSQYGTISLTHDGAGTSSLASGYSLDSLKTRQAGNICRIDRTGAGSTIIRVDFSQGHSAAMAAGIINVIDEEGESNDITFKTFQTTTSRTTSSAYTLTPNTLPGFVTDTTGQLVAGDLHDIPGGAINRLEVWIYKSVGYGLGTTIDIGRIWYGPAFQSSLSSGLTVDTGPEDSGGVELSRGGQAYPRVGVISRSVTIPMPAMSANEVFGSSYAGSSGALSTVKLESGAHSVGKTGEFLTFQESAANPMRPIYGHFLEMPRFTSIGGDLWESSLSIREER